MAPHASRTIQSLKKQRDEVVEVMKTRPGLPIYQNRLTELNKEIDDLLRADKEKNLEKKAAKAAKATKATDDIPSGNPPSIPTPADNLEPPKRERRAYNAAIQETKAQAEVTKSQRLVNEAKTRLDSTPETTHDACDAAREWLKRRESEVEKAEANLIQSKAKAAKMRENIEKGHANEREWQAKAESTKAAVDENDADLSTASPLPVQSKRKAEDNGKDEEQLQQWMAEREAIKVHKQACKENMEWLSRELKLAQEEKEAAESKLEELNSKIEAAIMGDKRRAH